MTASAKPTAEPLTQTDTLSPTSISPTAAPTVQIVPTHTPTSAPAPTSMPEARLFVPDYLAENVLAAIAELESAAPSWRWQLVNSPEQADITLEPGGGGVAAGFRATALTVPFQTNWDDITAEDAASIIDAGHESVVTMDWAVMAPERRALRVDGLLPGDQNYPLQQEWSLTAAEGFEMAASELAPHLRNALPRDDVVQLAAVGDLMLDRAIGYALENGDLDFPFGAVAEALASADITVGNLESALGDIGQPQNRHYAFRAPPVAAGALALAGFDLLSLANNHALDYGPEALQQGIQLLRQEGVATVGAGADALAARAPVTFEENGLTIAFLSYVDVPVEYGGFDTRSWAATDVQPGLAWADPKEIQDDVAAAGANAELVVVLLHSGYEYVQAPSPEQMAAAHAALAAGADLVLGHHAHVLQGVELRGNSAIVYGLGNFAFEIDGDPSTMIVNVWLDSDGVRQIELVPAVIEAGGRPRLAASWEAAAIRQQVYGLSSLLGEVP